MNFQMLQNADVEVIGSFNSKNHPVATAIVNGAYEHQFPANSRVSKQLDIMTAADLQDRLTGGSFFFADDDLVDFRDSHYRGFTHDNAAIQKLIEVIGYTDRNDANAPRSTTHGNTTSSKNITLSTVWSNHEIEVPLYQTGGQFNSQLCFKWNPFTKDIHSAFELIRLICSNGMVGMTSFLNTKIPLINRWEEHLEIASRQIQNKVSTKIVNRLGEMGTERATVAECQNITGYADQRMKHGNLFEEQRKRLKNIAMTASPVLHLGKMYKENVFADKRLSAQMPGHLSTFDVYNMATEIATHTTETDTASNHAVDKFANALVFDREDLTKHTARFSAPSLSSFSDAETAFFGDVDCTVISVQ